MDGTTSEQWLDVARKSTSDDNPLKLSRYDVMFLNFPFVNELTVYETYTTLSALPPFPVQHSLFSYYFRARAIHTIKLHSTLSIRSPLRFLVHEMIAKLRIEISKQRTLKPPSNVGWQDQGANYK